jgi:hypothetical protein
MLVNSASMTQHEVALWKTSTALDTGMVPTALMDNTDVFINARPSRQDFVT